MCITVFLWCMCCRSWASRRRVWLPSSLYWGCCPSWPRWVLIRAPRAGVVMYWGCCPSWPRWVLIRGPRADVVMWGRGNMSQVPFPRSWIFLYVDIFFSCLYWFCIGFGLPFPRSRYLKIQVQEKKIAGEKNILFRGLKRICYNGGFFLSTCCVSK